MVPVLVTVLESDALGGEVLLGGGDPGSGFEGSEGTSIGVPWPGWALTTPARVKARTKTNIRTVASVFIVLISPSPLTVITLLVI